MNNLPITTLYLNVKPNATKTRNANLSFGSRHQVMSTVARLSDLATTAVLMRMVTPRSTEKRPALMTTKKSMKRVHWAKAAEKENRLVTSGPVGMRSRHLISNLGS
jgi:hypothetical protein